MSEPIEGQRQAARRLVSVLDSMDSEPYHRRVTTAATSLAEAEARGHARGVAEAAQLRERVEGLAAEFDYHGDRVRGPYIAERLRRALCGGES